MGVDLVTAATRIATDLATPKKRHFLESFHSTIKYIKGEGLLIGYISYSNPVAYCNYSKKYHFLGRC